MNKTFSRVENSPENNADTCLRLSAIFQDLDLLLREHIEDSTQGEMNNILKKLKRREDLSSPEMDKVRLWIVGDAESYTKMENNFNAWIDELKRLMGNINHYAADQPDVAAAVTLRGLCRDGTNLLAEVIYFLQQKDRIRNFQQTTEHLTEQDRAVLIQLLQKKRNF